MSTPTPVLYGQPINLLSLSKNGAWVSSTAPTVQTTNSWSTSTCISNSNTPVPNALGSTNIGYVENLIIYNAQGQMPSNTQAQQVKYNDVITIMDQTTGLFWSQAGGTIPAGPESCTLDAITLVAPTKPATTNYKLFVVQSPSGSTAQQISAVYSSEASSLTSAANIITLAASDDYFVNVSSNGNLEITKSKTGNPFEIFLAGSPPAPPDPNGGGSGGGTGGGGTTPASTPKYVYYILGGVGALILLIVIFGAISNSKKKSIPVKS